MINCFILLCRKFLISFKVLSRLILEESFPDTIIKLIGNKLLSIFDIISENDSLSVEDTIPIRLKIASSALVPSNNSFYILSLFPLYFFF